MEQKPTLEDDGRMAVFEAECLADTYPAVISNGALRAIHLLLPLLVSVADDAASGWRNDAGDGEDFSPLTPDSTPPIYQCVNVLRHVLRESGVFPDGMREEL
jgi:hypothetical protein